MRNGPPVPIIHPPAGPPPGPGTAYRPGSAHGAGTAYRPPPQGPTYAFPNAAGPVGGLQPSYPAPPYPQQPQLPFPPPTRPSPRQPPAQTFNIGPDEAMDPSGPTVTSATATPPSFGLGPGEHSSLPTPAWWLA